MQRRGLDGHRRGAGSRRRALHLKLPAWPAWPALGRRREVWRPTLAGWALLLAVGALLVVGAARGVHGFLALDAPVAGARTLVVEGWLDPPALAAALQAVRRGGYLRVVTTGGPIEAWHDPEGWQTYAARGAGWLRAQGLAAPPLIAVPAPAVRENRTYANALALRAWARQQRVELGPVDVLTAAVHARRSRLLYRHALGDAAPAVGVIAAPATASEPQRWWTSSEAAKSVVGEALSLAWTACCFWPGAPP